MKNTQPIQTIYELPSYSFEFCEICQICLASKLIVTQVDEFYACVSCANTMNMICDLTQHLPN